MGSRPGPRADVAARRARVLALRTEHVPYEQIAAELGIPAATARSDYARALDALKREQDSQARFNVARQLAALDVAEQAAWQVLRARHITVQHGKIVRDEDGTPILDDAPTLNAIDRILRIAERRARLLGLDAPLRTKIEVTDALDADIERLVAELAGPAPGSEEAAAGAPGGGGEPPPPA